MAKPSTSPVIVDNVLQISISNLKEWGYLTTEQIKQGTVTWRNGNQMICSISIQMNTCNPEVFMQLDYKYKGIPHHYKVNLVSFPSNLGKGIVWYFICPQTHKRCRKLYFGGGYFLHRTALQGSFYESQIKSKKSRKLDKVLGSIYKIGNLEDQLNTKHFKKSYAGKPTKRYTRIMKQIEQADSTPLQDMINLLYY